MDKIDKTDEQWRAELSDLEYKVMRKHGTERAFSGRYCDTKTAGVYRCACCGNDLFDSETKFDSGTGWPSFSEPMEEGRVQTESDRSMGMLRTEVLCARCDAHLGHVFDDGPPSTGLRYCMNSCALELEEREE